MTGKFIQIPSDIMKKVTNVHDERNIYVHPNPLARKIFWQRLQYAFGLIEKHVSGDSIVLDFGGGSGAFLPSLRSLFQHVAVVDRDVADAVNIAEHFGFTDIHFYQQDINSFEHNKKFDLIVATDVLEHFRDMQEPFVFMERYLKQGGYLLLTLPSENLLYELGRILVSKSKPADHFHAARDLVQFYCSNGYRQIASLNVPRWLGVGVPLFYVGLLRKDGN